MKRLNADVVIALLLLTISAVFFIDTFTYGRAGLAIVGAKLWPRAIMIALGVLSALYLVQSIRKETVPSTSQGAKAWVAENCNVIACFALYALFLAALPWLGMLLGGIGFVFATLTVLGHRDMKSHLVHLAVAAFSVGLMWSIFTFALGVVLPEGDILPR